MKLNEEPRLPPESSRLVVRLTDILRELLRTVNGLLSRSDTPLSVVSVAVGASPFSYQATSDGFLSIVGGVGVSVAYIRQGVSTSLGAVPVVPVKRGDTARITYTTAPTVTLI